MQHRQPKCLFGLFIKMTEYNKTPTYNLSAVLQETGLKADLLRAWERRYSLPKPSRTLGGHRIYSPYDIEVIKWLVARQAEGLSIGRAVDLYESLIDNGQDPLIQRFLEKPVHPVEASQNTSTGITQLREDWIKACLDFNSVKSEEVLNQSFALQPVETVCIEILQRGLHEIGQGWYQDRVSAQQEHFASSLASRRLQTLISMTPPPNRLQTILLGCPHGELHTLPITLLDLFLRRRGIRVINLGADIPNDQMVAIVLQLQPDLIIMAAQTLRNAANLQNTFITLLASGKHMAYGGLIFNRIPALRERIPASFLGEEIAASLEKVEAILNGKLAVPVFAPIENTYQQLAQDFMEHRSAIDMHVLQNMSQSGLPIDFLNEGNRFFGNELYAALQLGDPDYMEADLGWVKNMLSARQISPERLNPYLTAYRDALNEVIGTRSAAITNWLGARLSGFNSSEY